MLKKTLFHELTGADIRANSERPTPLTPDTVNHFFLKSGHVMEFFQIGDDAKKVVSLFFGPEEYVLPSHYAFSTFVGLDKTTIAELSYGSIIRTLRKFPAAAFQYRGVREGYQKKVAERVRSLDMTVSDRFAHLKATQPWVLKLAKEGDIANYLRISVSILRELRKGK
jgi:hypothetical protein